MSPRSEQKRPRSRLAEAAVLTTGIAALGACALHASNRSADSLRLNSWWVYAGGVALAAGFVQLALPRTRTGVGVSVALAGFGVGMAGQYDAPRGPFALACLLYILAAQYALRMADPTRPPPRLPKERAGLAAITLATLAISSALALALPPVHRNLVHMATSRFYQNLALGALGDRLELGSLDGLARSDRVVLRIEGDEPYALRGVVYDTYRRRQWRSVRSTQGRPEELNAAGASEPVTVRPSRGTFVEQRVQGPWRTYYLPLGHAATALTQVPGLRPDAYGVVHPPVGEMSDRIALDFNAGAAAPSPAALARAAPAPPDKTIDYAVPDELSERLADLAAEWSRGATEPAQVMAALEVSLRRANRYSLQVPEVRGRDPVLAFLFEHRRGHCEYFASALALLGRSAGVATRVVAGYRTGDYNSVGRYYMVRDRHAHSWVEAYIPGRGWRTYDATPAAPEAPMLARPVPWYAAAWDSIFVRMGAWWRWLRGRPPTDALYIAFVLAAGFGLNRLRKRRGDDDDEQHRAFSARASVEEPTPASYEALCRALEARGVSRSPAEPLERYADRVASEPALTADETGPRAAAALRSYASLRYGSEGDPAQVDRALAACAAALVAGAPGEVRPAAQER